MEVERDTPHPQSAAGTGGREATWEKVTPSLAN